MKLLLVGLVLGLASFAQAQEFVNCNGTVELPPQLATGNCDASGNCQALPSAAIGSGTLFCDLGVQAYVNVTLQGGTVSGQCEGGELSATASGGMAIINGTCSDGGIFNGTAQTDPWVTGSCTLGGTMSATVSNNVTIFGTCS